MPNGVSVHAPVLGGRRLTQAVRPLHTRSARPRTIQACVRDAPDVGQRGASPSQVSGFLLVSRSSRRSASRQNTSFVPILVSRSPEFCALPPPSVLARTRLMQERQRRSRARSSFAFHTPLARATPSAVCASPPALAARFHGPQEQRGRHEIRARVRCRVV